jgi:hypothetical protein
MPARKPKPPTFSEILTALDSAQTEFLEAKANVQVARAGSHLSNAVDLLQEYMKIAPDKLWAAIKEADK